MEVPPSAGGPLEVIELHPLPPSDPEGLVSFYVTLAATILGFVTMFQLRANAPGLSLRGWLARVAGLAAIGGLVLTLIVDRLIGALHGPVLELWAALAAEVAAAALFNSAMLALIGRWAIVPTWGLFIAIGNASSGGAVAPPLPAFYRFAGRFLPVIVDAAWIVCSLLAVLLVAEPRGQTPGGGATR